MDETSLRELFERVIEPEPPIGPVAQQGIRAGIRLRRRRRLQNVAAGLTTIAVVAAAVVAETRTSARPVAPPDRGTVYVLGFTAGSDGEAANLTPIPVATNTPGTPIAVNLGASGLAQMAATPDEKTIYTGGSDGTVTPVSTATGTAGKPIPVGLTPGLPNHMVTSPDGKTVYVLGANSLTPISTATNRPGPSLDPWGPYAPTSIAISPDGSTLYVGVDTSSQTVPNYVIPVSTATDEPGKPIRLDSSPDAIVVAPDGRTAYVIGEAPPPFNSSHQPSTSNEVVVTSISTATNTAGPAVIAGQGGLGAVLMTPDGLHIYIATSDPFSLIPFSTATDSAGSPIGFGSSLVTALAATPDGRTVYAASDLANGDSTVCPGSKGVVTPVATATGRPGKPIQVACAPEDLAVTPNGKTVYVVSSRGIVTPIAVATDRPGTPIRVAGDLRSLMIAP
jgi:DNA-binding beta-propeller fold protein YncE